MDEIFSNLFPVKKRNQRKRRENRRFGEKNEKNPIFFEWEHCFFQKNWL